MKEEEKKYYVYVYLDPTKPGIYRYPFKHGAYCPKFEPIYVGAGKERRYKFFLLNKSRAKNEDLYNEIKQIRERNSWQDPIIKKIKIGLSRNESFKWEIKLIIAIGRLDLKTGSLFNRTNGGPGAVGMIQSEESKKKTGENSKKHWSDPEYKKKMKKVYKKRWENPESRKKMSEISKERWKNPEYRKNISEIRKKTWQNLELRKRVSEANGGEKSSNAKLTEKKVLRIRKLKKEGWSFFDLTKKFKVSKSCIYRIVHRVTWIHI